ncbi:MAG: SDR family oxidoreductase [Chthoniobacterales bacterium]|jgi:nucleoside-diphosphate-sugar epimerase
MGYTILLTGATGAIGQELVRVLAKRSSVDVVYALSRQADVEESQTGVIPLRGDVRLVTLGLSPREYGEVRQRTTLIIHAAADTRFSAPLPELRAINVEGTKNVLAFAGVCPQLRGLVALSTVHVAGKRTGTIEESSLGHDAGFVNNYEQSKYEAELILRERMKDLPIAVIRLSTVLSDSKTGEISKLAAIHQGLRLYYHSLAPMIPGTPDCPVDLIASDYAASGIAGLACDGFRGGKTFHLCGGNDFLTLAQLLAQTHDAFMTYRPSWRKRSIAMPAIVDLPTFVLFAQSVDDVGDYLLRHSVQVIRHFAPQLAYPKVFDDAGCTQALAAFNIEKPRVADFYPKSIRWLVESGWADRTITAEAVVR